MDETLIHKVDASDSGREPDLRIPVRTEDGQTTVEVSRLFGGKSNVF